MGCAGAAAITRALPRRLLHHGHGQCAPGTQGGALGLALQPLGGEQAQGPSFVFGLAQSLLHLGTSQSFWHELHFEVPVLVRHEGVGGTCGELTERRGHRSHEGLILGVCGVLVLRVVCQRAVDGAEGAGLAGVHATTAFLRGRPRGRLRGTTTPWMNSSPPQTPQGSRRSLAPARQASRTGQVRQGTGTPRRSISSSSSVRGSKVFSEGGSAAGSAVAKPWGGWLGSVVGPDVACWAVCTVSSFLVCRSGRLAGLRLCPLEKTEGPRIPVWDSAALRCRPDALSGWITPGFKPAEGPLAAELRLLLLSVSMTIGGARALGGTSAGAVGRRRKGIGLHLCRCHRYRGRLDGSLAAFPHRQNRQQGRGGQIRPAHRDAERAGGDDRVIGHFGGVQDADHWARLLSASRKGGGLLLPSTSRSGGLLEELFSTALRKAMGTSESYANYFSASSTVFSAASSSTGSPACSGTTGSAFSSASSAGSAAAAAPAHSASTSPPNLSSLRAPTPA